MKNKLLFATGCSAIVVGIAAAIVSLLPLPGSVAAAGGMGPKATNPAIACRNHERGGWMAAQLGLSAEQEQQMHAIRDEERAIIEPLLAQIKAGKEQLRTLGKAEPFSETAVRELAASLAPLHIEMEVAHARMQSRVRALLTPEQRIKADNLWADGPMGRHGRHGAPGPHGPEQGPPEEEEFGDDQP